MKLIKKILNQCRCKLWFKGMLSGITATVELEKLVKDIRAPETIIEAKSDEEDDQGDEEDSNNVASESGENPDGESGDSEEDK